MDIYIDVLVIVNVYITWIMLYLTKSITHTEVRPLNLAVASLIGGLSSLLALIQSEKPVVKVLTFTAKAAIFVIIVAVAFRSQTIGRRVLYGAFFIGMNALLYGAVGWMSERLKLRAVFTSNGAVYVDVSLFHLILTTAGVYLAFSLFSRLSDFKFDRSHSYSVEFAYCSNTYRLIGIADTGNTARDVFSGRPVIVCNGISLYTDPPSFIRAIPYSTVSGEGVLYAVKPEFVIISDDKGNSKAVDVLVASADVSGERCALFNPKILR